MTKVSAVRKVKVSILVANVTAEGESGEMKGKGTMFGRWWELGAQVIIYLSFISLEDCPCVPVRVRLYVCVCLRLSVCVRIHQVRKVEGGGVEMLKVSVDDLHAPSS